MANLDQADFDMMAQSIGFETASVFISYCETHSDTERALFNHPQIGTLLAMAGEDEKAQEWLDGDGLFISGDCSALCLAARARIRVVHAAPFIEALFGGA